MNKKKQQLKRRPQKVLLLIAREFMNAATSIPYWNFFLTITAITKAILTISLSALCMHYVMCTMFIHTTESTTKSPCTWVYICMSLHVCFSPYPLSILNSSFIQTTPLVPSSVFPDQPWHSEKWNRVSAVAFKAPLLRLRFVTKLHQHTYGEYLFIFT